MFCVQLWGRFVVHRDFPRRALGSSMVGALLLLGSCGGTNRALDSYENSSVESRKLGNEDDEAQEKRNGHEQAVERKKTLGAPQLPKPPVWRGTHLPKCSAEPAQILQKALTKQPVVAAIASNRGGVVSWSVEDALVGVQAFGPQGDLKGKQQQLSFRNARGLQGLWLTLNGFVMLGRGQDCEDKRLRHCKGYQVRNVSFQGQDLGGTIFASANRKRSWWVDATAPVASGLVVARGVVLPQLRRDALRYETLIDLLDTRSRGTVKQRRIARIRGMGLRVLGMAQRDDELIVMIKRTRKADSAVLLYYMLRPVLDEESVVQEFDYQDRGKRFFLRERWVPIEKPKKKAGSGWKNIPAIKTLTDDMVDGFETSKDGFVIFGRNQKYEHSMGELKVPDSLIHPEYWIRPWRRADEYEDADGIFQRIRSQLVLDEGRVVAAFRKYPFFEDQALKLPLVTAKASSRTGLEAQVIWTGSHWVAVYATQEQASWSVYYQRFSCSN